ncbi:putative toxin-antitoxin system toxin component, PIN family [Thauera linaloolentis]|uniref:PilT protein domain-containing protein n=1 Tax=Thauera linaloolentis (strain DSM 12138 / JCM 21573 / CCUG 41526 / CIP 105981 / IAM 15112 / NBRC 102519 / 47Lol) TaxID=1123367 RepID=N6XU47_THAL4|nr:putative toxin-antitoxin system toxin component, PIN family [Thauera linaloolentis]ENO85271.1 PilT protein domain-containing protein [Thauera linaloolentis 47Lol = DSM 12138]MCM8564962.1 putative toxin-antitoxin system toxin component, PIN family [Thauera linaloolentis]
MQVAECRLVLDTNTLVSRMLLPQGTAGRAVDKALGEGTLLASEATLAELVEVLSRPKFDRYVSRQERSRFIELLGGIVRIVPIQHRLQICRDPKDDMLLHVALSGEARYLITGDQDLLVLDTGFQHSHQLHILSPADYLALT